GPFEIRAVAFGGIVVAGALLLAALHHPLQDGSLQEIIRLLDFPLGLAEPLCGGAERCGSGCWAWRHDLCWFSPSVLIPSYHPGLQAMLKHFCPNLLHLALPSRLDSHGTGDHSAADSETIRPPDSAAANLAETGWTGTGLALRWGRHHLRWRSAGVKETGGANGNPAAVRRLLHRLPQSRSGRAPPVGSDHAARVRPSTGVRGSQ